MPLNEYISASHDAMMAVSRVIERRDWQRLDAAVELFSKVFSGLHRHLERFGTAEASEAEMSALRQLDIMHRKVMRRLSGHMRRTEEDLEMIGQQLN